MLPATHPMPARPAGPLDWLRRAVSRPRPTAPRRDGVAATRRDALQQAEERRREILRVLLSRPCDPRVILHDVDQHDVDQRLILRPGREGPSC